MQPIKPNKMKIKTYKETETELELPHFFKLKYESVGDSYYSIFNENDSLVFSSSQGMSFTSPHAVAQFFNNQNYQQITQTEFTLAYAKFMIELDNKATALLGIPEFITFDSINKTV